MDPYLLLGSDGRTTKIVGDTKIGRSKTNDLVLVDPLASRHHATIYYSGDVLMIRDEQSVNGTIVNGSRIYEPTVIKDRDKIQIGDEIFSLRAPLPESMTGKAQQVELEQVVEAVGSIADIPHKVGDYDYLEADEKPGRDKRQVMIMVTTGVLVLCVCVAVGLIVLTNLNLIKF